MAQPWVMPAVVASQPPLLSQQHLACSHAGGTGYLAVTATGSGGAVQHPVITAITMSMAAVEAAAMTRGTMAGTGRTAGGVVPAAGVEAHTAGPPAMSAALAGTGRTAGGVVPAAGVEAHTAGPPATSAALAGTMDASAVKRT